MNRRIRKKHVKACDNEKLTRGGGFTKTNSKLDKKWLAIFCVIVVLVGVILFVGTSYAYLYQTLRGQKSYSLKVKGFSLKLDDSSTLENIKIEESIPVSDEEGKQTVAYTFSIINEDPTETGYILYLDDVEIDDEINRMKDSNIKYQLIENGKEKIGLVSELGTHPFRILVSGVISGNTTNNYSLRFWIKEEAEVSTNQVFNVKIRVIATSKEAIEEGKLVFGDTVVTSDSGITQMTSDQLQTYVDRSLSRVLLDRYPVGSIYITTEDQNPADAFGGEWERFGKGKTLVGVDEESDNFNMIEKTGGNKNGSITMEVEQLPAHNHEFTPNGTITSTFTGTQATTDNKDLKGTLAPAANWAANGGDFTGFATSDIFKSVGSNLSRVVLNPGTYTVVSVGTTPSAVHLDVSHSHTFTATGSVTSAFTGIKANTKNVGNGDPISTQDPYITVYMWKRTN